MKRISLSLMALLVSLSTVFAGCSDAKDTPKPDQKPDNTPEATSFARGADVGWLTQLESEGHKFYDANGNQKELMQLLRDDIGVNAIRLRVWVNPADGWNGIDDVMAKARRAHKLGMRLMIDFHFADTWADPGHQPTPEAWKNLDLEGLKGAVAAHVDDMLGRLKAEGIEPEWVQVGNETTQGML